MISGDEDIAHFRREKLSVDLKQSLERLHSICYANRDKFGKKDEIFDKVTTGALKLKSKRYQKEFSKFGASLTAGERKEFNAIVSAIQVTVAKRALEDGDMVLSKGNILYSEPGGGRQSWHYDFPLLSYSRQPRVFIIPISKTARLDLCRNLLVAPEDNEIVPNYTLKRGELFTFDGHLPHRGSGYEKDNFRIHFYSLHRNDQHYLGAIRKFTEVFPESSTLVVERKKGRPKKKAI